MIRNNYMRVAAFTLMLAVSDGLFVSVGSAVTLDVTVLQYDGTPARNRDVFLRSENDKLLEWKTTDSAGRVRLQLAGNPKCMHLRFADLPKETMLSGTFDHVMSFYFPNPKPSGSYGAPDVDGAHIPELAGLVMLLDELQRDYADEVVPDKIRAFLKRPQYAKLILDNTNASAEDDEQARESMDELREQLLQSLRELARGWDLGIEYEAPDVEDEKGALITKVMAGSPAERSGLRRNDRIIAVGIATLRVSIPVTRDTPLQSALRKSPENVVDISYSRDATVSNARVTMNTLATPNVP